MSLPRLSINRAWKNNRPTLWARSLAGLLEALNTLCLIYIAPNSDVRHKYERASIKMTSEA